MRDFQTATTFFFTWGLATYLCFALRRGTEHNDSRIPHGKVSKPLLRQFSPEKAFRAQETILFSTNEMQHALTASATLSGTRRDSALLPGASRPLDCQRPIRSRRGVANSSRSQVFAPSHRRFTRTSYTLHFGRALRLDAHYSTEYSCSATKGDTHVSWLRLNTLSLLLPERFGIGSRRPHLFVAVEADF